MSGKQTGQRQRHGHDEGTSRHRADGRWEVRFNLPNGKPTSRYGKSRADARAKFTEAMAKAKKGLSLKADRQSLADFLAGWLEEVARPNLAYSTVESYESYLKNHIVPELGHIELGELTPQDVQRFLNSRTRTGRSPRTVQYLRAILRSALAEAVAWGYIERNSASLAKPPKMERQEVSALTAAEAKILIASTADDRLGNLLAIAVYTGLRQGERLGLRWQDTDLEQGTLQVRKAIQTQGGQWKFIQPKTERARRTIYPPETAVAILASQQRRVKAGRRRAGSAWQNWNLVLPSPLGFPLSGKAVTSNLRRKLAEAGLPRVRFHDPRHTCATLLLDNGVHERVIIEQLGHFQISLTLNTYSHVRPAMLSAAASALDRALGAHTLAPDSI